VKLKQLNLGADTTSFISPLTYNDDKWHTIDATRVGKEAILKVDDKIIETGECNGKGTDLQVCITLITLITSIVIYLHIVYSFIP
jgi:hypothetical protein